MARVDGATVQGVWSKIARSGPPRPNLYGELPRSAPIVTTLPDAVVSRYMMTGAPKKPSGAYMTGNGTVFRDQTICRYISHPQHPEATWRAYPVGRAATPFLMSRQTLLPKLELPAYSPLYGGSGRNVQSRRTGLGRVSPLDKREMEIRSTGFFGA